MAIYELTPAQSQYDSMTIGELIKESDPGSLVECARDILDQRHRKLGEEIMAALYTQLAGYKLLTEEYPTQQSFEAPVIATCETPCDFIDTFYSAGNSLVDPAGEHITEVDHNIDDLSDLLTSDTLIRGAVEALELREKLAETDKALGRVLLFNATTNAALAYWREEYYPQSPSPETGVQVELDYEAVRRLRDGFKSNKRASHFVGNYLDLRRLDTLEPDSPRLHLVGRSG